MAYNITFGATDFSDHMVITNVDRSDRFEIEVEGVIKTRNRVDYSSQKALEAFMRSIRYNKIETTTLSDEEDFFRRCTISRGDIKYKNTLSTHIEINIVIKVLGGVKYKRVSGGSIPWSGVINGDLPALGVVRMTPTKDTQYMGIKTSLTTTALGASGRQDIENRHVDSEHIKAIDLNEVIIPKSKNAPSEITPSRNISTDNSIYLASDEVMSQDTNKDGRKYAYGGVKLTGSTSGVVGHKNFYSRIFLRLNAPNIEWDKNKWAERTLGFFDQDKNEIFRLHIYATGKPMPGTTRNSVEFVYPGGVKSYNGDHFSTKTNNFIDCAYYDGDLTLQSPVFSWRVNVGSGKKVTYVTVYVEDKDVGASSYTRLLNHNFSDVDYTIQNNELIKSGDVSVINAFNDSFSGSAGFVGDSSMYPLLSVGNEQVIKSTGVNSEFNAELVEFYERYY